MKPDAARRPDLAEGIDILKHSFPGAAARRGGQRAAEDQGRGSRAGLRAGPLSQPPRQRRTTRQQRTDGHLRALPYESLPDQVADVQKAHSSASSSKPKDVLVFFKSCFSQTRPHHGARIAANKFLKLLFCKQERHPSARRHATGPPRGSLFFISFRKRRQLAGPFRRRPLDPRTLPQPPITKCRACCHKYLPSMQQWKNQRPMADR